MIAELADKRYASMVLGKKCNYNQSKIDNGVAELIHTSQGEKSLEEFKDNAELITSLSSKIKLPYHEVVISFPIGERFNDEKLIELTEEYMKRMTYDNTSYAIVRHDDTEKQHVHVLFTALDINGKQINIYKERFRSQKISRQMEKDYNLKVTEYNKFKSESLNLIEARKYYVSNALQNGLKKYTTKEYLHKLLADTKLDFSKQYTNEEIKQIIGEGIYNELGHYLEKNKLFNRLYKDEILSVLDEALKASTSVVEFKQFLEDNDIYIRAVTPKGKTHFVYGLNNPNVYFKDSAFPLKFRYENLTEQFTENKQEKEKEQTFPQSPLLPSSENKPVLVNKDFQDAEEPTENKDNNNLDTSEQKHLLYNLVFLSLNSADDYSHFKEILHLNKIDLQEHTNSGGVYGLSFTMNNVSNPVEFKASELSRRLSYNKIQDYFNNISKDIEPLINNNIVIESMENNVMPYIPHGFTAFIGKEEEQDLPLSKRRKRRKGKGLNK